MGHLDIPFETFSHCRYTNVFERRKKPGVAKFWISILNEMKFIRFLIFLLLIPAITNGQTVHVDSNRIVYKGAVKFDKINKQELYERAKNTLLRNVKGSKEIFVEDNKEKGMISEQG